MSSGSSSNAEIHDARGGDLDVQVTTSGSRHEHQGRGCQTQRAATAATEMSVKMMRDKIAEIRGHQACARWRDGERPVENVLALLHRPRDRFRRAPLSSGAEPTPPPSQTRGRSGTAGLNCHGGSHGPRRGARRARENRESYRGRSTVQRRDPQEVFDPVRLHHLRSHCAYRDPARRSEMNMAVGLSIRVPRVLRLFDRGRGSRGST
jgi:hypothetical protein